MKRYLSARFSHGSSNEIDSSQFVFFFLSWKPNQVAIPLILQWNFMITLQKKINCNSNSPVCIELKELKPLYSSIVNFSIYTNSWFRVGRGEARRKTSRDNEQCAIFLEYFFFACSFVLQSAFWAISNSMLFWTYANRKSRTHTDT